MPQPSQPQGVGPEGGRRVALPPEDFPPAGAIPVDDISEADVAPLGVTATITTITVPDSFRFRITGIGFDAEDESALRFLSWSLFVNPPAVPLYGYVNMPAGIGSVNQPRPVFLVLGSSVVFTIVIKNNCPTVPGTYHFTVATVGYFYAAEVA